LNGRRRQQAGHRLRLRVRFSGEPTKTAVEDGRGAERKKEIDQVAREFFAGETVSDWSSRRLEDRELRKIATVGHDKGRLGKHILPVIGTRPIAEVTREDIERVVEALDAKIRLDEDDEEHIGWKTAANC
jgi:hypothetical protein